MLTACSTNQASPYCLKKIIAYPIPANDYGCGAVGGVIIVTPYIPAAVASTTSIRATPTVVEVVHNEDHTPGLCQPALSCSSQIAVGLCNGGHDIICCLNYTIYPKTSSASSNTSSSASQPHDSGLSTGGIIGIAIGGFSLVVAIL